MNTSAKNYTKKQRTKKKTKWTVRTLGQMGKANYTDKITQRSLHIHTQKKRKMKKIYI